MLQIIRPDTDFDFIRLRGVALALSALVIGLGIASLIARGGPNYGIDFTGGIMVQMAFDPPVPIDEVRGAVATLAATDVQEYGGHAGEYLLRVPGGENEEATARLEELRRLLRERFGESRVEEKRTEVVGPRVGAELRNRAILSVIFATVLMGVYIAMRFDLRFGVGAGVALAHDVMITVGALSIANFEIDLTIVAALLTIVGYSVNDTVVISDRIRENLKRFRKDDLRGLINRSINETLSRTLLTSGATLLVVVALFLVGGPVIHGFAFSLLVGFIAGVYSTVFIATPIVDYWETWRGRAKRAPSPA